MGERIDRFLDGRICAQQMQDGFRSGTDAVLLAAAVPARARDSLLELGSGAGIASLCLAARVPGCRILGIEIEPALVELAEHNARRNGLDARVSFQRADVLDLPRTCRRTFDHVFLNPPFHGIDGQRSPRRDRARALHDDGRLGDWLSAGLKRVSGRGTLTAILRADRLDEALTRLPPRGVSLFPLWPTSGKEAKRILVQARKSARAPLVLLAGLVLHEETGHYSPIAEDILRGRASLALASPPR